MRINLNNESEFTIENLKRLISSVDDSENTQYRVTDDGYLFLSTDVGNQNLDGILFRLETNVMGNSYAGKKASENKLWVDRVYKVINDNWPEPYSTYIDNF